MRLTITFLSVIFIHNTISSDKVTTFLLITKRRKLNIFEKMNNLNTKDIQ